MAAEDSITPAPGRLDPWYVTGLCDGEACFFLRYAHHKAKRVSIPGAMFCMDLRADDKAVLERVRDFFGCGKFYFNYRRLAGESSRRQPKWSLRIHRVGELMGAVVPHFRRYPLQAKKNNDFAIWEKAVTLMHEVWRRKRAGSRRRGGVKPKWTAEAVQEFLALYVSLRAGRVFPAARVAAPPARPRPPEPPSLFDGLP